MTVVGVLLIMSYNRVPQMAHYWSLNCSLRNAAIQKAMSRDRFLFFISKLYFNCPEKPADASKLYYIEAVVSCLKCTFLKCFTDSTRQSIDESMVKFKGRSSLKQYQPIKSV
ncbi:Chimeric ERCC6-PGBD3 protein [Anthophora quadrimaculata]